MSRDEILTILERHRAEICQRFSVKSIRLFGSAARDEATAESDIDILVSFTETPSLIGLMRLRFFLEDLLKSKVDLITETGLKEHVRPYVEKDAISVA